LELVQTDITEFYIHKQGLYLVLLLDNYSRFLLGFRLIEQCNMEEIKALVDEKYLCLCIFISTMIVSL